MPNLEPVDLSAYLAQPTEPELELLRLFPPSAALTIFDIGSCEGEDSIRYSRRFHQARVFAFEPLPANQAIIRANLARYGARNVELVPIALSDRAGTATFHLSSGHPNEEFAGRDWNYGNKSSSLLPPAMSDPMHGWIKFEETITVPTNTLDSFCRQRAITRVDFIHMDVQGAEQFVLNGADVALRNVTALWLEVSDQPLYRGQALRGEIEAFMHAHGFSLGFEVRREIEGDQFYVNRRRLRAWPYLGLRRARGFATRAKRRLFG